LDAIQMNRISGLSSKMPVHHTLQCLAGLLFLEESKPS